MLVGYPPFYSDDPITTCRKIVHWRNHLKFPEDAKLSPEAKDLIIDLELVVPAKLRLILGSRILWDKLYEMDAAFKPEVNGELDTQNFMKFDELLLTSKDLSFVGHTYKNFDAVKALRNSSESCNTNFELELNEALICQWRIGLCRRC